MQCNHSQCKSYDECYINASVVLLYLCLSLSDPRVADWMWMGSPLPTVAMIILYLAFVNVGPRIMKNREPLDMKPLLFVFNTFIVAFNFWMAWEVNS